MLANEEIVYKKAYRELYEVIGILTQSEKSKIPKDIVENIKCKMDNDYEFYIDSSKTILEQNLMPETQALIIMLYQKYLSPKHDDEKWKKYNQICFEKIESEKRERYNPDKLFKNDKENQEIIQNKLIVIENKSFIKKIIEKLKTIFKFK